MPASREDKSSIIEGVAASIGATVFFPMAIAGLAGLLHANSSWIAAVFFVGVLQFVYMVPIAGVFLYFGRKRAAIGLIPVTALVFLLNAACWGLIATAAKR